MWKSLQDFCWGWNYPWYKLSPNPWWPLRKLIIIISLLYQGIDSFNDWFPPHTQISRALLPTFRTNCPDGISLFAQIGSCFAQIPTPHPYSLISYHILHLGFCTQRMPSVQTPKHHFSFSDKNRVLQDLCTCRAFLTIRGTISREQQYNESWCVKSFPDCRVQLEALTFSWNNRVCQVHEVASQ